MKSKMIERSDVVGYRCLDSPALIEKFNVLTKLRHYLPRLKSRIKRIFKCNDKDLSSRLAKTHLGHID